MTDAYKPVTNDYRRVTNYYRRVTDDYRRLQTGNRRVNSLNTTTKQHFDGLFLINYAIFFKMVIGDCSTNLSVYLSSTRHDADGYVTSIMRETLWSMLDLVAIVCEGENCTTIIIELFVIFGQLDHTCVPHLNKTMLLKTSHD
jgi:hypothetical protein